MDWLFETPWMLWVVLALAFAVIEMLSLDLFFLMLAISAGITAAISPFVDNMLIRTVIFVVICLVLVLGLRPPLLKKLNRSAGNTTTNVEALIGSEVRITQDVTSESGLVVLAGDTWTARTPSGTLPAGSLAKVRSIDGATAIVEPLPRS